MRTATRPVPGLCLMVVLGQLTVHASAQNETTPQIVLHSDSVTGSVGPRLFGASLLWPSNPGETDPESGLTYPRTVEQIKDVGISLISYPGGPQASLFQWQRSVGPRMHRQPQVSDPVAGPAPIDGGYGPDEFGDLLDQTGAVGDLIINFGTASAADAANFAAYMTAPIGSALVNGVDWASRRAANRHPKPYAIAYVAIGNGYPSPASADQNSWITGDPVAINLACATDKISCLYAFGGSTRFEHQTVVQPADWRETAAVSTGELRQTFYARYAPVAAGTETVWVDAVPWQGMSDLAAVPGDARAYRIDYPTGAISFGDGTHGAIPPKGSRITVSYTSGPHGGFVDFYRAVKAISPSIKVCSSIGDESFIRIMGAHHAYDCIQQHASTADSRPPAGDPDVYLMQMASAVTRLGEDIRRTRELVQKYAGANAPRIELIVNEYGSAGPALSTAPHFAHSAGAAVLNALYLRECVLAGATAATYASLTDHTLNPAKATSPAVPLRAVESIEGPALFAGSGPETIVTPAALAMKLLRQHTGTSLLASGVEGGPKVNALNGDGIDALQIYATRDQSGKAYLVVINVDPRRDIGATVRTEPGLFGATATVTTLAPHELSDENTPTTPQLVALSNTTVTLEGGTIKLSFPKHSVTGISLTATQ